MGLLENARGRPMHVADEKTKSLWMDTRVADAPPLDGDSSADVAIIGAGIAGLSTAYELIARGRSVIVRERPLAAERGSWI
jgi:ribulose 1,5-bisphosphate synthetase/thiazole synthase